MIKSKREQRGAARVQHPQRLQVEMHMFSLDQMIRENHLVRTVDKYVDTLDLSELYQAIKSTVDRPGRDCIDPRMLFSLWFFATLEGINSGRRIADLTKRDLAYMWICGGVSVNYHTVCDFRSSHKELLDRILTDSVAVLHYHDLIKLETIAQDGMRVRASAGTSSFRTQGTLEKSKQVAAQYMEQIDDELDDDEDLTKGQRSARKRAAKERLERTEAACLEMQEMQDSYEKRNKNVGEKNKRSEPRASTSDPEARRMKMGDGGCRPALNVQFASDVDTLVIVSADVTNVGSDSGQLTPMYEDVVEKYGVVPEKYLADGGFSKKSAVTELERNGTEFYGPLYNEQKQLDDEEDPYAPRDRENELYTKFRARMGTDEAKEIYRRRAPAAEFPNAICRNQGLQQFSVRGMNKANTQTLWHALAYNFRRFMNLTVGDTDETYLEVLMTS